jgi:hypothetical protein
MAVGPSSERLFPTLTEAQIHRIAAHGRRRQTTKGEVLVEIGDTAPFFVVVRGAIQVLSPTAGAETVIVMHSPGQFTGEANMMTGRRSIARSRWTFQSVDQEASPQVTGTSSTLSQPSCRRAGYRSTLSRHTNSTTALVLVLMDNLERIPVGVEYIGGIVSRIVFQPCAWRNVVPGTSGHRGLVEFIDLLFIFGHETPVNGCWIRLPLLYPEERLLAVTESPQIGMTVFALVRHEESDMKRLQGRLIEGQRTFDITDGQNHVVKHRSPLTSRVIQARQGLRI